VIAYFDTSAVVPLLIEEIGSDCAAALWDEAGRVTSARLVYPEARAALAQARRMDRIDARELRRAVADLDRLLDDLDLVEVTDDLARRAGELAEAQSLRAYDAVHVAAAELLDDADLVVVAGDGAVLSASRAIGLSVATTS
jgi:hypothetical protein